jgi:hypothetical protein
MRIPRYALLGLFLCLLTACKTLDIPTPTTFNERLAGAYTTVTGIRETASTLLLANKLTAEDAQNVQQQCDTLRAALDVARQVHAADPQAGGDKLTATLVALNALSAYLAKGN